MHGVLLTFTLIHGYICKRLLDYDSTLNKEFIVRDKSNTVAIFFKRVIDFLRYSNYGKFLWIYGVQFYIIAIYKEINDILSNKTSPILWMETYRSIFVYKIPFVYVVSISIYIYGLYYFLLTDQVIEAVSIDPNKKE